MWAARGTTSASDSNAIVNSSYEPLSQGNGPFTIAFWFKSGNTNPGQSYIIEGGRSSTQWAVIYGYVSGQIEFFTGSAAVRVNTGISIKDTNWHHIAYRKSGAGSSSWDKFLDGVKTNINPSINFTLPGSTGDFFAFNADNFQAPCVCSLGDVVVYNSAQPDVEIQAWAAGNHPALSTSPLLYWPLEGTNNPEPDASGNNHPGTVRGNVIQVPDPPYGGGSAGSVSIAEGSSVASGGNVIRNTSFAPLAGNSGPFTIAFWFQSNNVNPAPSYIAEGNGNGQWAIIYGYTSHQIEFFLAGNTAPRQGSSIPISDTNWHHIVYRKDGSGSSSWERFLDGVKTTINSSIAFSLPSATSFFVLNADNELAPCQCSIADFVAYNSALPDSEIKALAAGNRPTLTVAPALYWPLSATSTQEPDLSGKNHPGTVLGSIQAVPGPPYLPPAGRSMAANAEGNSAIENTSFPALSSSNGPFTIAFWFQSLNTNPGNSYVLQGHSSASSQWAVIYGYTPQEIEFYTGSAPPRQNSGITITDERWHHVVYRKSASGSSSWDKFLDGVKTNISPSINFTLAATSSFHAFNASIGGALCHCSLADVVLYATALSDTEVQSLARGARPPSLVESPVLYWPMTGSVLEPDDSGKGNVGTVVGNISTVAPPPYSGEVTISPSSAELPQSGSQQFSASISGGSSSVSWFINPQVGSISASGLYQAPASVATLTNVTVTAVNDANPLEYSTATITFEAGAPPPTTAAVLTAQYDTNRTNSNPKETALTPGNVNVNQFGKLFTLAVDGYVYAQPLYVPAALVAGLGQNTVFVATMNNTLYAFNADTGTQVWSVSLGPAQGAGYGFLAPQVGVLSTPVIDPTRKVIYVVGRNSDGFRLHAIDLIAHTEKPGSPVLIQGSVPGPNGYDRVNGTITFNASQHLQRPGLLLANNTVYVGFASISDIDPWHGWLFGFEADTLAASVFSTTPNGGEGGLWMGGGAPAVDQSGNIYVVVANGTYDGQTDFGESFLKLSPTMKVLDWFTPSDYATLNSDDADLGSTRAMLLPSTSLLVGGGKDGSLWLLNQGALGHLQGGVGNPPVVQTFLATTDLVTTGNETNGLWDGMAYWSTAPNGPLLYIHGSNDVLKAFRFSNGTFNTIPVAQSSTTRPFPGGVLAVSSNGSSSGILWATTPDAATNNGPATGVLRAFDALSLTELWNSNQNSARDSLGMFGKFAAPTVVNGKVYVATFSDKVLVYGLLH